MKRLYWRPAGPSALALCLLGALALGLVRTVEHFPLRIEQGASATKRAAAERAERAFAAIREERPRRGLPLVDRNDRAGTGLIGPSSTSITTSAGSLPAKRTAANPNFAAALVDMLLDLGLKRGDVVAIGYSGSFPALNIATLAAADTLGLVPLSIASAASSDFGASAPQFSWLDMEVLLVSRGLVSRGSVAASIGGIEDRGIGLGAEGLAVLEGAIQRSGAARLTSDDFEASLSERMEHYERAAGDRAIRAYVNVGGGAVSVGRSRGKMVYQPGINRPAGKAPVDSIIGRFLDRGVPVIHLSHVEDLARAYELPLDPAAPQRAGEGEIFVHVRPNVWLSLGAIAVLGVALTVVGRRARARAHLATLPDGVVGVEAAPGGPVAPPPPGLD
ncbi:MAG TPA: poly-gamma-glutamate system protein [Polyangiaceae bacterium]|nr:poly-gamma-glutamate system protein [Polyangiaceae bacterium]